MENVKCSICVEKDAKIVMLPHWRTGVMTEFNEATCGHPECLRLYDQFITEEELMMDAARDYSYED